MKSVLALFVLLLITCPYVFPQVDRASVTGTLRDSAGAVVPGGEITVTYPDTGLKRTVSTNASGVFFITSL
ncbi:MAG: carboxypeptidase regulatory-like domain-containing protein, partial [Blastocatellia bacterium]|nr:carboxypeptidase regulatory-like domain-containing protein [Blastocatellia bacterium]